MLIDFNDMITAERVCQCGAGFTVKTFRQMPESGPKICDNCAIELQHRIDNHNRLCQITHMVITSHIPEKYRTWDKAIAETKESGRILPWLAVRQNESAWIQGPHDIGKTHAALYGAFRRLAKTGQTCEVIKCVSWFDWMIQLKYGNEIDKRRYNSELQKVKKVHHLVLDDLGKEGDKGMSPDAAKLLLSILDHRAAGRGILWITTNLSGKQIERHVGQANSGPAVLARLTQMIPKNNVYHKTEETLND